MHSASTEEASRNSFPFRGLLVRNVWRWETAQACSCGAVNAAPRSLILSRAFSSRMTGYTALAQASHMRTRSTKCRSLLWQPQRRHMPDSATDATAAYKALQERIAEAGSSSGRQRRPSAERLTVSGRRMPSRSRSIRTSQGDRSAVWTGRKVEVSQPLRAAQLVVALKADGEGEATRERTTRAESGEGSSEQGRRRRRTGRAEAARATRRLALTGAGRPRRR